MKNRLLGLSFPAVVALIVGGLAAAASAESPKQTGAAAAQLQTAASLSAGRAGDLIDGKVPAGAQVRADESAQPSDSGSLRGPGTPAPASFREKSPALAPAGHGKGVGKGGGTGGDGSLFWFLKLIAWGIVFVLLIVFLPLFLSRIF